MSYFYSLRGWLEISPGDFRTVISELLSIRKRWQITKNEKQRLYMEGWCWNDECVNWTHYLFYGADVTEEGLVLFCDTIRELTLLKVDLSGYFHALGEDREKSITYRIENDILLEEGRDL
ncbi:hypothetical protein WME94_53635 [Sorangium sp. So ce429]